MNQNKKKKSLGELLKHRGERQVSNRSAKGECFMKKENIHKILFMLSLILVIAFAIAFGYDAYMYCSGRYFGSAPLYVYLIGRAVEFLILSAILFVCGIISKRRLSGK